MRSGVTAAASLMALLPVLVLLVAASAGASAESQHRGGPPRLTPQLLGRIYAVAAGEVAKDPAGASKRFRAIAEKYRVSSGAQVFEEELSPECGRVFSSLLSTVLAIVGGVDVPEFNEFLKWLDSIAKPEAGILLGNVKWIGSREECEGLRLPVYHDANNASSVMFSTNGRYCTFMVNDTKPGNKSAVNEFSGDLGTQLLDNLELAICLPNPCKGRDAEIAINYVIQLILGLVGPILQGIPGLGGIVDSLKSFSLVVKGCSITSEEVGSSLQTGAIIMIALTVLLVVLILLATVFTSIAERAGMSDRAIHLKVCRAFCLRTNLTKLFSAPAEDSLPCLNGIRVLSIFWVILGHSLLIIATMLDDPLQLLNEFRKRWQSVIIINATTSVDSFFLLSGTLVAYLFFRRFYANGPEEGRRSLRSVKFWLLFYFHRYWRLTPPLMFFLFWQVGLLRYFGNGAFLPADRVMLDTKHCQKNWWTVLLYVQNFVGVSEGCMGHTWYLANDMQMYLLSPLMLIPFVLGGTIVGSIICVGLVAVSMICTGVINSQYGFRRGHLNFVPGQTDGYYKDTSYYELIYIKPYCRVGAYAIGILLGYVLATKKSIKLSRAGKLLVAVVGWLLAATVGLALLYLVQPQVAGTSGELTLPQVTTYWSFLRPGFALCVAWVVFACVYGLGGPVNQLLSWSWWAPLARLTYCTYLVHVCVMYMFYVTYDAKFHLSDSMLIMIFLSNLMASFLVGLLLSMLIEAPLLGIERLLLGAKSDGHQKVEPQQQLPSNQLQPVASAPSSSGSSSSNPSSPHGDLEMAKLPPPYETDKGGRKTAGDEAA